MPACPASCAQDRFAGVLGASRGAHRDARENARLTNSHLCDRDKLKLALGDLRAQGITARLLRSDREAARLRRAAAGAPVVWCAPDPVGFDTAGNLARWSFEVHCTDPRGAAGGTDALRELCARTLTRHGLYARHRPDLRTVTVASTEPA